jgi:hypothetical protein
VLKRSPNKSNHAFIGISLKKKTLEKTNKEVTINEGISNVEAIQEKQLRTVHQH